MSDRQIVALGEDQLARLPDQVARPRYDRAGVRPGIVHFGVGGFHRAHQAMYLDALMNSGSGLEWGIVGVGVLAQDERIVQTLTEQDCLYTLVQKHPDGHREARVIGSIIRMLFAPHDPQAVLEVMSQPGVRIVSLTITEGSYLINQATGQFDPAHPSIAADLQPGSVPASAFGFIVEALRRRRAAAVAPFTVMSCDNLPGNGTIAKQAIVGFARLTDPELADWIERDVAFPNAMVDRITPVTSAQDIELLRSQVGIEDGWPVVCEPFSQWVLEDDFPEGRPELDRVGVQLVTDVVPFELMKLRLLNAGHQALCYLGYLSGYRYAHEVAQDPLFDRFLLGYMSQEARPTLPEVPGQDLSRYSRTLIKRFANPQVRDTLARLCAESSDRIPQWLVPVIRENLNAGRAVARSALVVAAWARYAEGVDEQGAPIEIVDHRRKEVMAAAARSRHDPLAFIRDRTLFGDLAERPEFTEVYLRHRTALRENGARATLEAVVAELKD